MPDFLTHVLVLYIGLGIAGQYLDWLTPPWIVLGMAGGLIPDASKIALLLPADVVESAVGIPFSWFPLTSLVGSLLIAGVVSLFVTAEQRARAFGLLSVGAVTHLLMDLLLLKPAPTTFPVLYPITLWEPPTVGLYLSSDPWPAIVAILPATVVFGWRRYQTF